MTDVYIKRRIAWLDSVCHETVTRRDDFDACGRPAVAVRYDQLEGGNGYPVCRRHVREPMVPLVALLSAREGTQ